MQSSVNKNKRHKTLLFLNTLSMKMELDTMCGGENLSLCVGLEPHSLIIMRPRGRKHGKRPRNR